MVTIGNFTVGSGRCFFIAEAGVNHNGEIEKAIRLIDCAADSGADAVKFQSFRSDLLVTTAAEKAFYQKETTGADQSQQDMLRHLELSNEEHFRLKSHCDARGIMFLSTPFDVESVDLLARMNVPAFKIPSGEITNLPLLEYIGGKGKPVILSTGMSNLSEVEGAVEILTKSGSHNIVILHCVSSYPAQPLDVNLRAMDTLRAAFGKHVGYSDHTTGIDIALAAAALGAVVIEKHFTLSCDLPGPDHRASLEPEDLAALIRGIRRIEAAMGSGTKRRAQAEEDVVRAARRSLVTRRPIAAGEVLDAAMVTMKRPGTGLSFDALGYLIGRRLRANVPADTLLSLELFE